MKGDEFGTIESVKAASEVYAPVGGVVTEVNTILEDEAKLVNDSPDVDGWMIKIEIADASELDTLLTEVRFVAQPLTLLIAAHRSCGAVVGDLFLGVVLHGCLMQGCCGPCLV